MADVDINACMECIGEHASNGGYNCIRIRRPDIIDFESLNDWCHENDVDYFVAIPYDNRIDYIDSAIYVHLYPRRKADD